VVGLQLDSPSRTHHLLRMSSEDKREGDSKIACLCMDLLEVERHAAQREVYSAHADHHAEGVTVLQREAGVAAGFAKEGMYIVAALLQDQGNGRRPLPSHVEAHDGPSELEDRGEGDQEAHCAD
jgi:hypothetical protein